MKRLLYLIPLILFAGCKKDKDEEVTPVIPSTTVTIPNSTTTVSTTTVSSTTTVATGKWIDTWDREAVLAAYHTVFDTPLPPINWEGDTSSCNAGKCSAAFLVATVSRMNYYRSMVGIAEKLILQDSLNGTAQLAAYLSLKNRSLNHYPPATWKCYSSQGLYACSRSNLAMSSLGNPDFAKMYIDDEGEGNKPVGHRYWVLSPRLTRAGLGVTGWGSYFYANGFYTFSTFYNERYSDLRSKYLCWPSEGYVPQTLIGSRWSLNDERIGVEYGSAVVKVNGKVVPILNQGAFRIVWEVPFFEQSAVDKTYEIEISNVLLNKEAQTITYKVVAINP